MPIFDSVSTFNKNRPLYQFGHTNEALQFQFDLLFEFAKHADAYFSKVVEVNLLQIIS